MRIEAMIALNKYPREYQSAFMADYFDFQQYEHRK